jgi:CRISPR/Cas system-associated exonuclease Cas4 (RecB family)
MKLIVGWCASSIVLITGLLISSPAYPQAAAEYGMAASKSTTLGAKAGSSMRSTLQGNPRQPAARGKLVIPGPPTKNMEMVMEENRQKLANDSKAGGGSVQISSVPPKATIAVDGSPVGISPLEVKLPQGKHVVELSLPQYDVWGMEVTVSPNESTAVTAQLEKKYKSSITLSIQ